MSQKIAEGKSLVITAEELAQLSSEQLVHVVGGRGGSGGHRPRRPRGGSPR